jgi:tetratricopeptide (TPR) repeat protein
MSSTHDMTEKNNVIIRLTNFLQKHRKIFLYTSIGLAVVLVALIVYLEWQKALTARSTALIETAQESYQKWSTAEEAERAELESSLRGELSAVIEAYPRSYAGQRALFIRGGLEFDLENWEAAAADYLALADGFSKSYLAPVALFNTAVAYERLGRNDDAAAAYQRLVDRYGSTAPQSDHALFSLGRLAEERNDPAAARSFYNRLVSEYPDSGWTGLARNRIIYLTARGSGTAE